MENDCVIDKLALGATNKAAIPAKSLKSLFICVCVFKLRA